jgi:flagellar L-ring protein precursor FlgH
MTNSHSKLLLLALALLGAGSPLAVAGSLWTSDKTDERGMFTDKRASRVGDIVTVVVQENVVATNTLELKTAKDSSEAKPNIISNLVNQFLTALPGTILGKNKFTQAAQDQNLPKPPTIPQLSATGSNTFTGGGDIKNSESLTARASVTVIDVLPNGNLVVEGVRVIRFGGETQYGSLRGVVRPQDIQKDNTVLSTSLADAQVEFVSEGSLTDSQKKGWLAKLAGKLSPF